MCTYLICSGNGKVPSVLNTLAIYDEQDGEPFKLRTDTSHHSSLTVEPYAMTNVGNSEDFDLNSQPLDVPSSYGKLDPNQMLNTDDRSVPPKVSNVHSLDMVSFSKEFCQPQPLDPPDSYDKFEPKHAPGADYRSVLQQVS